MQAVGLIRELEPGARVDLPGLLELRGLLPEHVIPEVLRHLGRGVVVVDFTGVGRDPLDDSVALLGGPGLVSDGHWVWRVDLPHFVERYAVGLDPAFLTHVRAHPVRLPREAVLSRAQEALEAFERAKGLSAP